MRLLVALSVPADFDERVRAVASRARITHARPGEDGYEEALAEAEVILGWPRGEDTRTAPHLRWLQLSSAGADNYIRLVPEHVTLTTANGVHGVPVAEHAMALMLSFARGIHTSVRKQLRRHWETASLDELADRTCGILGAGDIGRQLAKRAYAFGMRVLAFKRTPADPPPFVEGVYGAENLQDLLQASDYVVNTLPETPETRRLIDQRRFSQMKAGSVFINVGRGRTVDEDALIDSLRSGHLRGAGLDVFETEPLPSESPLWEMPNVVVTPHDGGQSPRLEERVTELFISNLRRYMRDEELVNVVDRRLGY